MKKIRVLVVDDAVVVRRLVVDALAAAQDIDVVGVAANGKIALSKLNQVNPDLVTMDVEMPEMDGLEAITNLRQTHPRLPVIMFSTLTRRGGEATLEALARGANDYVTKPANVGNVQEALNRVRQELIPKIRMLCGRSSSSHKMEAGTAGTYRTSNLVTRPVELVVIAASTGGPTALAEVIGSLPATFPVPVAVVQHMPPVFTRLLAERLGTKARLPVAEATSDSVLSRGQVLIAPGDFHM